MSAESTKVVFHYITPVFEFQIIGASIFTHTGRYEDAIYKINLRPYQPNLTDWNEVTEYASDGVRDMLRQRAIHVPTNHFGISEMFLVADMVHESEVPPQNQDTQAGSRMHYASLDGLQLHSQAGMRFHETYQYRWPDGIGLAILTPNSRQATFPHAAPSILHAKDFAPCRVTIDLLMRKTWSDSITFDKILQLAMQYHRISFTLERVDHAFLILMVAYEAMFKREFDENASRPAQRIGRLLATTLDECKLIQHYFNDGPLSFSKLRNRIAHGDHTLTQAEVKAKYPILQRHVAAAIIALLNLPAGTVDTAKDYYDEIHRYTETRSRSLPRR